MCAMPLDLRNCSARAKGRKAHWPCEVARSGVSVVQPILCSQLVLKVDGYMAKVSRSSQKLI